MLNPPYPFKLGLGVLGLLCQGEPEEVQASQLREREWTEVMSKMRPTKGEGETKGGGGERAKFICHQH